MRMKISHVEPVNDSIISELIVRVKDCASSTGLCQSQLPRAADGVDARFRGHDKALLGVVTPAKSLPSWKRGRGSMSCIRSHRTLTRPCEKHNPAGVSQLSAWSIQKPLSSRVHPWQVPPLQRKRHNGSCHREPPRFWAAWRSPTVTKETASLMLSVKETVSLVAGAGLERSGGSAKVRDLALTRPESLPTAKLAGKMSPGP